MGTANPVYFILAVLFVSMVGVFGLGLMFARASNIERNYLVGGLTSVAAIVAVVILANLAPNQHTGPVLLSTSLLGTLGYVVGRAIDMVLGPRDHTDEATLGADLAD